MKGGREEAASIGGAAGLAFHLRNAVKGIVRATTAPPPLRPPPPSRRSPLPSWHDTEVDQSSGGGDCAMEEAAGMNFANPIRALSFHPSTSLSAFNRIPRGECYALREWLPSHRNVSENEYRVTVVVADLGWVDLDLGSSPGWWSAIVHS